MAIASSPAMATIDYGPMFNTFQPPDSHTDPADCASRSIETFFDMPGLTGRLREEHLIYGYHANYKDCPRTNRDIYSKEMCDFMERRSWCAFSNAVPATLLPEYNAYLGSARAWWEENNEAAAKNALECPMHWYQAKKSAPYGDTLLNLTLIYAGCPVPADNPATEPTHEARAVDEKLMAPAAPAFTIPTAYPSY